MPLLGNCADLAAVAQQPSLTTNEIQRVDAYWRACNYLCAKMIYLHENALLKNHFHKLTYRRTNHANIHVRGYKERGNINTPLELAIRNKVDRFNLSIDVIDRIPRLQAKGAHVKQWFQDQIIESMNYAYLEGIDKQEVRDWKWTSG